MLFGEGREIGMPPCRHRAREDATRYARVMRWRVARRARQQRAYARPARLLRQRASRRNARRTAKVRAFIA